jgi:endonuclease III
MLTLETIVDHLARLYGQPEAPPPRSLFELVVWENVAYLVDDDERARAFAALRTRIGLTPEQLASAPEEALEAITGHGILAAHQADKLRKIAQITRADFDGDLEHIRAMPLPQAKRALMRFPSIGEPGAEKILLFARAQPVLGLDSNGVRVLTRLGVIKEERSYSATYRAVQRLAAPLADHGCDWLIRAHQLLRKHGQELCRRNRPQCARCPLSAGCAFFSSTRHTD